jgi:hypothetical protein
MGPGRAAAACVCDPDMSWSYRSEWAGPYSASASVDVNLGNTPAAFVQAAYWQVNGAAPSAAFVSDQVGKLTGLSYWRRIDTVNTILSNAGSSKTRTYSDPWTAEPALTTAPCKNVTRDVGAVFMLFFDCPGGVNCGMDWANNHVLGMQTADSLLGFGASPTGYYKAINNAGMCQRELLDARYAGLEFFLPNIYGWDITDGSMDNMVSALNAIAATSITAQVKIGMFDDTWGWGNGGRPAPWNSAPNMSNTVTASDTIFNNKWAPYFDKVPSQYWYTVGGKPLIYFYNAGTLNYVNSANVLARLKTLFQTRYGVLPFLVVDDYFWQDSGMSAVADGRFVWRPATNLINGNSSTYTYSGVRLTHSMPRWDPIGRDSNGSTSVVATAADGVIKDDSYVLGALSYSASVASNLLVFATWNDLGEGTGLNRAYDYYWNGDWQPPTVFMDDIRASQSLQSCPAGSPTPTPTLTATLTASPSRTVSPTSTATRSATASGTPTDTPSASPSATPTLTPSPSVSPSPSASPSFTNGPTATPSASPSVTPSATLSFSPSLTLTPSPSLTVSPTQSLTPTPSLSLTVSPTLTLTLTPAPSSGGPVQVLAAVPFPNPQGGPVIQLRVQLSGPTSRLRLGLYTQALVRTLSVDQSGSFNAGWNTLSFPGADGLPLGLYFGRVFAPEGSSERDSGSHSFRLVRLQ